MHILCFCFWININLAFPKISCIFNNFLRISSINSICSHLLSLWRQYLRLWSTYIWFELIDIITRFWLNIFSLFLMLYRHYPLNIGHLFLKFFRILIFYMFILSIINNSGLRTIELWLQNLAFLLRLWHYRRIILFVTLWI